ncbi:hypothetical protein QO004_004833 [Rhizobium mesoamericanum]|uniref:hypothetical protein n=1 Tax=Rhizobium mesoamericanum TaxID=1079800 RepID=UPI002783EBBB|nr:hypothetical protein [Rhizobium mesoamericanum]MDQ0563024.1 hypothetical protein [Rhizobium mesoamericanum]
MACLRRAGPYRAAEDIACVGWILTAIQERVEERNLPDWFQLKQVVDEAITLLPLSKTSVH